MDSQTHSNLSFRELKALRKDDLIRIVLNTQKQNFPESYCSVSNLNVKSNSQSPSQQCPAPLSFPTMKEYLSKAVSELKEELSLEFTDKMSHLSEEVVRLQSEVFALKKEVEASRTIAKSEILSELREQESRRSNLILFGAEEGNSDSTELGDFRKQDEKLLSNIKTVVKLPHDKIRSAFRLGKGKPDGHPGPLKVAFESPSERD